VNIKEYTVSEISTSIQNVVENNFSHIRVKGEISGLKIATSGHVYFTLKDEKSILNSICWRGVASKLKFKIEDGLEVICTGKVTTYAGRSNYQIIVSNVEIAGKGALLELFEKRKKQLAEEGLFNANRKKPIPFLPDTIGIITSPTGSVIRDILHRLKDRFPRHVLLYPTVVQGDKAAEEITKAIAEFNKMNTPPDVIIIARGGGSLEDLWAFNEEILVRAVAGSNIPIISAVGHETDTTLIDYASDRRSPTPTAAAEITVPVRADLINILRDIDMRMDRGINKTIKIRRDYLDAMSKGLPKPHSIMDSITIRLDEWGERLLNTLPSFIDKKSQDLASVNFKPILINSKIDNYANKLANLSSLVEQLNYKQVLKRGFAVVRDENNKPLLRAKVIEKKQKINIEFYDDKKSGIIN